MTTNTAHSAALNCNALTQWLGCTDISWSIGTSFLRGEFMHDSTKTLQIENSPHHVQAHNPQGAIRIRLHPPCTVVEQQHTNPSTGTALYEYAWQHTVNSASERRIRHLGADEQAIRPRERSWQLYDLGIGSGAIQMYLRTNDPTLMAQLDASSSGHLFSGSQTPSLYAAIARSQPQRVVVSPLARIEIFQAIPAPGTSTPEGPHTHVFIPTTAQALADFEQSTKVAGPQTVLSLHSTQPLAPLT